MQTPQEIVRTLYPDDDQRRADQRQAAVDHVWNNQREHQRYVGEYQRKFTDVHSAKKAELIIAEGTARGELHWANKGLENFLTSQQSALNRAAGQDYTDLFIEGKTGFTAGDALRAQVAEAFQKQYPRLQSVYEDCKAELKRAELERDSWLAQNPIPWPPRFDKKINWVGAHP